MIASLDELAGLIKPERTILFLGAGASVPSGAPAGVQLARKLWQNLSRDEPDSNDFTEICSILEMKFGRQKLISEIKAILSKLQPSGGVLSIPEFNWHSIYTTNYDQLIELAYNRCKKQINIVRSNFDYEKFERNTGVPLYKIHGCISQDITDGHRSRLIVTERDNEEHQDYREVLFKSLDHEMATKDTLVIGYSFSDAHLKYYLTRIAELRSKKSSPGRIFALMFNRDQNRAMLWENRGFTVTFGGIDEFFFALSAQRPLTHQLTIETDNSTLHLPTQLRPATVDVRHAATLQLNAAKLFNGSPATYADIKSSLTFKRSVESTITAELLNGSSRYIVLVGVAGVGKTTLARRLLTKIAADASCPSSDVGLWEAKADYPWRVDEWIHVEQHLRDTGRRGFLLVDECQQSLRQINNFADRTANVESPALKLILTSDTAQWFPRTKSPELFSKGKEYKLSKLTAEEIDDMVNLVDNQPAIRSLVDTKFSSLSRHDRIQRLQRRCSADMYVCLKNIFATDELDDILLREYATLHDNFQDTYRHVAALEASGTKVHRQLVLRLLGIQAPQVAALLVQMDGLVEEYDIDPAEGLYGWSTRHEVIAQTIARYKYADQEELWTLLQRVIDGLNPTLTLELRTLKDICVSDYGIPRLTDPKRRISLYEKLIKIAPGIGLPRHRLIRTLMDTEQIELANQAIRDAEDSIGLDPVIGRYKVKLSIHRAENTSGIRKEDRLAILRDAENLAIQQIQRFGRDKQPYMSYLNVGISFAELSRDVAILDSALGVARDAAEKILDPQLIDAINEAEKARRRLQR